MKAVEIYWSEKWSKPKILGTFLRQHLKKRLHARAAMRLGSDLVSTNIQIEKEIGIHNLVSISYLHSKH